MSVPIGSGAVVAEHSGETAGDLVGFGGPLGSLAIVFPSTVFFFQAEDGIRDWSVTGVQTCALPICASSCGLPKYESQESTGIKDTRDNRDARKRMHANAELMSKEMAAGRFNYLSWFQIGRASCRERV